MKLCCVLVEGGTSRLTPMVSVGSGERRCEVITQYVSQVSSRFPLYPLPVEPIVGVTIV